MRKAWIPGGGIPDQTISRDQAAARLSVEHKARQEIVSEIIRDELNQHMANSAFIDYGGNTRILFFDSVGITAAKLDRA
jgi:hypothetical protein